MRAYELQAKPGLDSPTACERAMPRVGANQVLVKVKALSLNYRDILTARGAEQTPTLIGRIALSDGAGEIAEVGAAVTRVKVGDRVAGSFMQKWIDGELDAEKFASALGGAIDGMAAQYVALDEQGVVRVPKHLSFEEAACLPCAAVTAWDALRHGGLRAGQSVLLLGTGGVSIFALQFAKLQGARVIITSSSDEKLELARKLGADETINYQRTPNWDEEVLKRTDGRGADMAVEVGGPDTLNKTLNAVRVSGAISIMGTLTGMAGAVNTIALLRKRIKLQGIFVGSRATFEDMNRAIELHRLQPVVNKVFAFDDLRAAYQYQASQAHAGKIVVRLA
jgi:NADPH:quinone reductase-like Zn-dependent oxidoreductase